MLAVNACTLVVIGKIGAPYGVRGWMHLHSFTDPKENIKDFSSLLIKKNKQEWESIKVLTTKSHGNNFVINLFGIDDRNQAALFTNCEVAVNYEDLPEIAADEYYCTDLLGLDVYNELGLNLGKVIDLFATGANDVLVVKGDKEYLIPYVPKMYILNVCFTEKKVIVSWDQEF